MWVEYKIHDMFGSKAGIIDLNNINCIDILHDDSKSTVLIHFHEITFTFSYKTQKMAFNVYDAFSTIINFLEPVIIDHNNWIKNIDVAEYKSLDI